jgi:iron(II)-dependent oxidoreductase
MITYCSGSEVIEELREARGRTLALVNDLDEEQMIGPQLKIVNPLRWEIGHVAWFQEYWVLRHLGGRPPLSPVADKLYDSARVAHETRWDLPLPSKRETIEYTQRVLDKITDRFSQEAGKLPDHAAYFLLLALFHEDMHAEAMTYTRQTLGYPPPDFGSVDDSLGQSQPSIVPPGDAVIPGGELLLGAVPGDQPFAFDNEMQAHEIRIEPFAISRTAVTNADYVKFVRDEGYERPELWSEGGWRWRELAQAQHPVHWAPSERGWLRRNFDRFVSLEENLPIVHVNWYEADAYCRWAGRRLPTEPEWEMAAGAEPTADGHRVTKNKRRFPWGNEAPTAERANLDWRRMGCIDVGALQAGDSAFGVRQMIGNVWEWTATVFEPYPGFVPGHYKEYSAPWFGDHKVLRGGCWTTRSRLIRNTYRNFYTPDRRDVWAGFRTCAP